MPDELTISVKDAAKRLGFPVATTERVARDLGLLVFAGNRKRIDPKTLPEFIEACRKSQKERGCISIRKPGSTSSATPAAETVQQAREIAAKLKGSSRST